MKKNPSLSLRERNHLINGNNNGTTRKKPLGKNESITKLN